MIEAIPTQMYGYTYLIFACMVFTFATWLLHDGIKLGRMEGNRGDSNRFTAVVCYGGVGVIVLGALWNLGVVQ